MTIWGYSQGDLRFYFNHGYLGMARGCDPGKFRDRLRWFLLDFKRQWRYFLSNADAKCFNDELPKFVGYALVFLERFTGLQVSFRRIEGGVMTPFWRLGTFLSIRVRMP